MKGVSRERSLLSAQSVGLQNRCGKKVNVGFNSHTLLHFSSLVARVSLPRSYDPRYHPGHFLPLEM